MSPAKAYILDIIVPKMEAHGYRYLKGSTVFSKKQNDLDYRIRLRFDGRGGLTLIDCLEFSIESPHYNRLIKKLVGKTDCSLISSGLNFWTNNKIIIPVPYSQKALDVANTMNMTALAQIPFEEKYPKIRMDNTAKITLKLIEDHAFLFFNKYPTLTSIYDAYALEPESKTNPMHFTRYRRRLSGNKLRVLYFILIANDLNKPLPDILYKYKHFYNDMIFGFGHMGKTEHLKKSLLDLWINYNPK